MAGEGAIKLSANLKKRIGEIVKVRDDLWKLAFMDTYEGNLVEGKNILVNEITKAINTSKEYKYDQFKTPLLQAANNLDTIEYIAIPPNFDRIVVVIDFDKTAGSLEDYAKAVDFARKVLRVKYKGSGPDQSDADYWKEIYLGTRTPVRGLNRKRPDTGRTANLYERTIAVRTSFLFGQILAPWWSLLDQGNAGTMGGDASFAHPAVAPTHFVENARNRINTKFNDIYTRKLNKVTERFLEESVDERNLTTAVVQMVGNVTPNQLIPGTIFGEITIAAQKHFLYASDTRKLALSQRPRSGNSYISLAGR